MKSTDRYRWLHLQMKNLRSWHDASCMWASLLPPTLPRYGLLIGVGHDQNLHGVCMLHGHRNDGRLACSYFFQLVPIQKELISFFQLKMCHGTKFAKVYPGVFFAWPWANRINVCLKIMCQSWAAPGNKICAATTYAHPSDRSAMFSRKFQRGKVRQHKPVSQAACMCRRFPKGLQMRDCDIVKPMGK